MAESLGVLTLDMVARTVNFDQPLQKSEQQASKSSAVIVSSFAKIEKQSEQTSKAVAAFGSTVKASIAAIGIGGIVRIADEYTQTAARISNATKSASEYNEVQKHLYETANGTYRSLKEAQEVFLATSGGLQELGYSTSQVLAISDSLSYSFVANATAADKAQSAMDSYGSILDKNKVDADAWFSLMAAAPNILNDVATATGKTTSEIRKLGAEGKLAASDLHKGLLQSAESNKALADSMVNSAADGGQKLSNAISRVVGEMNRSSGATAIFADGLGIIADNIDIVSAGMVVGGAYMLGTYVPGMAASTAAGYKKVTQLAEQASVQMAAVAAEKAAATSALAAAQAQIVNTQATLSAIQAERALEVERLKSQISAQGRMASMTRMAELGRVEAQVKRELAAATAIETAAQERANAVKAASLGVGRSILGVLGGPVGLGITVATVAAGYLMMRDSGEKANSMLESQSRYAGMAADELSRLDGAKRKAAQEDLSKEVGILSTKLKVAENQFESIVEKVLDSNKANKEAYSIWAHLRAGAIGVDEAYKRLNQTDFVTSEQINQLTDSKKKVDDSKVALQNANTQLDKVKTSGQSAKQGFTDAATGAQDAAGKVVKLNDKLLEFNKSLENRAWDAEFKAAVIAQGKSAQEADLLLETYRKNQAEGVKGITAEQKKLISNIVMQESALSKLTSTEKTRTSELEKQQQILKASSAVQANAAKYNFSGLESKYGLPTGMLASLHAIETGNSGKTAQVNASTGATGGFQFLKSTAQQYGVKDRTNMGQSAEGAAKYMSYLLGLFKGDLEKAVRAYHAGEGNVQKGKNLGKYNNDYWQKFQGYMAGANGYSAGDLTAKNWDSLLAEAAKAAEQQAELRKSMELNVADEVTRIRSKLADDLEEIDKAAYSPEKAKALKAEYQARADNEIAVAEQALKTKADSYLDYLKTEEQFVRDSYAQRQFEVKHDLELTKSQREEAVRHLSEQLNQELELVRFNQEERRFQMTQSLLDANARSEKYWDLERKRIELNVKDLEERNRQLSIANALEAEEKRGNLKSAVSNWGGIESDMTGTRGKYDLDQERFSRIDASQDLFDSQIALAETAAEREAIWQAHHERMNMIESDYQAKSIALQASYGAQFAGLMQGLVDSSSSAYAVLGGIQRGAALFSTAMNSYTAISAAWASAPFPYNLPAVTMATMETGLLQAAVSALSPQGYATGGLITGAGTGTSDDIPIMASNGEFMMRHAAVQKIGQPALNYMNRYGELPSNSLMPKVGNGLAGRDMISTAAAAAQPQHLQINNILDPGIVGDFMGTTAGTKTFINFIKNNRTSLKAILA